MIKIICLHSLFYELFDRPSYMHMYMYDLLTLYMYIKSTYFKIKK